MTQLWNKDTKSGLSDPKPWAQLCFTQLQSFGSLVLSTGCLSCSLDISTRPDNSTPLCLRSSQLNPHWIWPISLKMDNQHCTKEGRNQHCTKEDRHNIFFLPLKEATKIDGLICTRPESRHSLHLVESNSSDHVFSFLYKDSVVNIKLEVNAGILAEIYRWTYCVHINARH